MLNGNEKTIFKIADILYIQAQGNGLQITTTEGKHWRWQRLRNVLEILPNPPFIQTHRSYIVNGCTSNHPGREVQDGQCGGGAYRWRPPRRSKTHSRGVAAQFGLSIVPVFCRNSCKDLPNSSNDGPTREAAVGPVCYVWRPNAKKLGPQKTLF